MYGLISYIFSNQNITFDRCNEQWEGNVRFRSKEKAQILIVRQILQLGLDDRIVTALISHVINIK
jgi:hypothetical protein